MYINFIYKDINVNVLLKINMKFIIMLYINRVAILMCS